VDWALKRANVEILRFLQKELGLSTWVPMKFEQTYLDVNTTTLDPFLNRNPSFSGVFAWPTWFVTKENGG
jgi:hypothetical protein